MKDFVITILLILTFGCATSKLDYEIIPNRYSNVYKFKNSKSIVFNDSVTREWLVNNNRDVPISLTVKEIIALNKKLEKDYVSYVKKRFTGFDYDELPDKEHYKNEDKKTIADAKDIQHKMKYLNKQLLAYKDSLGRNIIVVKVIIPQENQRDAERYWVGNFYTLKYNLENSTFLED